MKRSSQRLESKVDPNPQNQNFKTFLLVKNTWERKWTRQGMGIDTLCHNFHIHVNLLKYLVILVKLKSKISTLTEILRYNDQLYSS